MLHVYTSGYPPIPHMPLIKTGGTLCDDHEVRLDSAVCMKRVKLTAPSTFQPNLLISGPVIYTNLFLYDSVISINSNTCIYGLVIYINSNTYIYDSVIYASLFLYDSVFNINSHRFLYDSVIYANLFSYG